MRLWVSSGGGRGWVSQGRSRTGARSRYELSESSARPGGVDVRLLAAPRGSSASASAAPRASARACWPCLPGLCSPARRGEGEQRMSEDARRGDVTTITTAIARTVADYSSTFGAKESVKLRQPTAASRVLNRINSPITRRIDGRITSNGRLYFVNPAGIIIGPTGAIDASAILAGTGWMLNKDFLRGMDRFTNLTGSVVNRGRCARRRGRGPRGRFGQRLRGCHPRGPRHGRAGERRRRADRRALRLGLRADPRRGEADAAPAASAAARTASVSNTGTNARRFGADRLGGPARFVRLRRRIGEGGRPR